MIYWDLIKLAVSDIVRRKLSSGLTFFAISVGIIAVFLIILVAQGFENSIQNEFEELGTNRVYITPFGGFSTVSKGIDLTEEDVEALENEPYVKNTYRFYSQPSSITKGRESVNTPVLGTELTEDFFKDMGFDLEEGRFARENEEDVALLGSRVESDLFKRDISIGEKLEIKGEKFEVIGKLESRGSPQDDRQIYASIDSLQTINNATEELSFVYAMVSESEDVNIASENIQRFFDNRIGEDTVEVRTQEQVLSQFSNILSIVQFTLGGIALVSLLVGALGIINTMFVIVTEKVKEIGIMKSVGARNFDILFIFTFEAGTFGLLGAVVGVMIGGGLALIFERAAQAAGYGFLEISIGLVPTISMILFGFFIGIVSGLLPAYRASKITVIDALRK